MGSVGPTAGEEGAPFAAPNVHIVTVVLEWGSATLTFIAQCNLKLSCGSV